MADDDPNRAPRIDVRAACAALQRELAIDYAVELPELAAAFENRLYDILEEVWLQGRNADALADNPYAIKARVPDSVWEILTRRTGWADQVALLAEPLFPALDIWCHCSEYQSSGLPCLPGQCPNNPNNTSRFKP